MNMAKHPKAKTPEMEHDAMMKQMSEVPSKGTASPMATMHEPLDMDAHMTKSHLGMPPHKTAAPGPEDTSGHKARLRKGR